MPRTGSKYLADALEAYGVRTVFMTPTVAVTALAEMDRLGVAGVMTHGEKAAAYMADGYTRALRAPGICMAQTIGSANLRAAGLRDAYMAGSPVIAITGGTSPSSRYRHVYQEIEDYPLYEQVTKFNAQVQELGRLPDLLRQAFREATSSPSGPVHLELDGVSGSLLEGTVDDAREVLSEERFAHIPSARPLAEPEAIRAALECIAAAERPVIVAGGGVRWSGAEAEVRELAGLLGIPVATSLNAKGAIKETDPLAVGVVGSYSRAPANQTLAEADLVFFIGSHTGSQVTDNWRLPAFGTTVVQLDADARELGRNYPNAASLLGDAKRTLAAMIEQARTSGTTTGGAARQAWRDRVAHFDAEWRDRHEQFFSSDAQPIRPERICRTITEVLPDDGVLVVDTGHSGIWSTMTDLHPGQMFLRCAGSLGWAFPASLGVRAALPERPVVCFTGDGGFFFHLAELETAARHNLDAVIVVNNNRSLSQDKAPFVNGWGGEWSEGRDRMWMFKPVDLAEVARSLGCEGVRIEDPAQLAPALKEAMGAGHPVVLDVVTDLEAFPDPPHGGRSFYASADER